MHPRRRHDRSANKRDKQFDRPHAAQAAEHDYEKSCSTDEDSQGHKGPHTQQLSAGRRTERPR